MNLENTTAPHTRGFFSIMSSSYGTVEIDISSEGTIQQTVPLELRPHVPESQWRKFCQELQDLCGESQKRQSNTMGIGLGVTVLGFLLFGVGAFQSTQQMSISPLIPVAVILFMGGMVTAGIINSRASQETKVALQRLCDETSRDLGRVTVHYRERTSSYTTGYGDNRHVHHTCHMWLEIHYPITDSSIPVSATVMPYPTAPTEAEIPIVMAELDSKV